MKTNVVIPPDFFLGAAASAWQTEGWNGKKDSQDCYMDAWYKNHPEAWYEQTGPAEATRFHERYKEDIALMQEAGLDCYRTSINWARFLTDYEKGIVDAEYCSYYRDMLIELRNAGIHPMICLEHYEVPMYIMETYDGWSSRQTIDLFVLYARKAFEAFGDLVDDWFVFNEPVVMQTRAYLDAIRWPFEQNSLKWMQWNYNKALATSAVVQAFKQSPFIDHQKGKIGTIINVEMAYPANEDPASQEAARMYDLFYNRIFLDPALKGIYPREVLEICSQYDILPKIHPDDQAFMKENTVDWVGINLYHPNRVIARRAPIPENAPFHPNFYYEQVQKPGCRMNPWRGWEIDPDIMYDFGMIMKNDYPDKPWFVAESGMGVMNENTRRNADGEIQDDYRIDYMKEHLARALDSREDGSDCRGFMVWAFTDNVSPGNAFKNRYGLVEINLEDGRSRRLKKSGRFFHEITQSRSYEYEPYSPSLQ